MSAMAAARAARHDRRSAPPGQVAARPVPALRVVRRHAARARRPLVPVVSAMLVAGSLFTVVIGHAVLAEGQVRLAQEQAAVTAAEALHRQSVLSLAQLEDPSRIVSTAATTLHMVAADVVQLPYVSLTQPLPVPTLAAPPSSSTQAATTAGSPGTSGTSGTPGTSGTSGSPGTSGTSGTSTSATSAGSTSATQGQ